MCVANSARSQLAEGLARKLFGEKVQIESAGSVPTTVNPFAIRVLKEIAIDISAHRSKSIEQLTSDFKANLDYVITLCAEEVCPVIISSAQRLHWPLPDPAVKGEAEEAQLARFRAARDEIMKRLNLFAAEIGIPLR